jgi:hypothetical protein
MRSRIIFALAFILSASLTSAQVRTVKPIAKKKALTTRMGFGGGVTRSEALLQRNIKDNNPAVGFNLRLTYNLNRIARPSLEYVRYSKINIEPTWYNVKAHSLEFNMNWLARVKGSHDHFYLLTGVSYNVFEGYFTGINDYLNLSSVYNRNAQIKTRWGGLNAGVGFEKTFKPLTFFGEFKMRVGLDDNKRDITPKDVLFSAGIRLNIIVPTFSKLFSGTRSRYLLDKSEEEDD